ncbi:MAG: hypothetical protein JXR41_02040 [Bacteroidales bacterium]|nr:hypothetical protein [Bacteroidales bacterium]MBN2761842.1 hypothetical protein [Bacteroidales bacterium]
MKAFLVNNINGILATVIVHLLLIMFFLFMKIGEVREQQQEQMLIELIDEMQTIEEIIKQEKEPVEIPSLDPQTIHNIAVNMAEKMNEELSTEKYEQEVMEELGIESLKPEIKLESPEEVPVIQKEEKKIKKPKEIKNIIYKENATIRYNISNRWHIRDIYVPAYKCEEGGTVVLHFTIDQKGFVIQASIDNGLSTNDPCLRTEAHESIISARFNNDPEALPKQEGTITYVFFPQ